MLRATTLLPIAVAVALTPSVASAATVTSRNIVSPSKNLRCHALKLDGPGIECGGKLLPNFDRHLDLNPYIALKPRGTTDYGERSNYTGYGGARRTLKYGDTWKRSGITCKLTRASFRCTNRSKHGFTLTKSGFKRF